MDTQTTIHEDNTVTYWSVYEQVWKRHAEHIPSRELAAMPQEDREKAIAALQTLAAEVDDQGCLIG